MKNNFLTFSLIIAGFALGACGGGGGSRNNNQVTKAALEVDTKKFKTFT